MFDVARNINDKFLRDIEINLGNKNDTEIVKILEEDGFVFV